MACCLRSTVYDLMSGGWRLIVVCYYSQAAALEQKRKELLEAEVALSNAGSELVQ